MIILEKYQVINDGCVMNNDTGQIFWPKFTYRGNDVPPFHILKDDNGKFHYFSVKDLMSEMGIDYEEEVVVLEEEQCESIDVPKYDPANKLKELLGFVETIWYD